MFNGGSTLETLYGLQWNSLPFTARNVSRPVAGPAARKLKFRTLYAVDTDFVYSIE